MVQWKALTADTLAAAICHCMNFQQGLKRDENLGQKLISPTDIGGKIELYPLVNGNCTRK